MRKSHAQSVINGYLQAKSLPSSLEATFIYTNGQLKNDNQRSLHKKLYSLVWSMSEKHCLQKRRSEKREDGLMIKIFEICSQIDEFPEGSTEKGILA